MDRLPRLERTRLVHRNAVLRSISSSAALVTIAVSASVLAMYAGADALVYGAHPYIFQMKPNSAIGFAAAGAALGALAQGRLRLSAALAVVPTLIGGLTLLEYVGLPVRIDEMLIRDWHVGATGMPGRSPPNTAAVLLLVGSVFLFLFAVRSERARRFVLLFVPLATIAVAMEALAGHIGQSAFAVGWWTRQPMSFPSVLCALSLGAGMLAHGWQSETAVVSRVPLWMPLLGFFGVSLIDICTPLEVNSAIFYLPLVACAIWFQRAYVVFAFAAMATLLILFGLFASPPGHLSFAIAALNRAAAIGAVWLVAAFVSGHHRIHRRLRHSEHHFATAQTLASVGSFELRFADMSLRGSDAFQTMHGLPIGEEVDWPTLLRGGVPVDEHGMLQAMIDAARRGEPSRDLDYSFLRAGNDVRNMVMHADLLVDAQGKAVGVIGVVHDVSEVRRAEARQAEIEVQLRHAQKLESLGMFAGGIAHDLNNTLVPITMLMPLLMETADASERQILDLAIGAALRAKDLVREILAFSRREEPELKAIRLDLLVREAMTIIRAGVPASIIIADELAPVSEMLGSKGQIYQTILNLATNAAQAIGDRAGTITIGTRSETRDGDGSTDIRLFIADDGPGMDVATARRIFEPYFSTKPAQNSTGLGLAIVNKIVKRHGGSILVRSTPGEGTRFDLLFPAIRQQAA